MHMLNKKMAIQGYPTVMSTRISKYNSSQSEAFLQLSFPQILKDEEINPIMSMRITKYNKL